MDLFDWAEGERLKQEGMATGAANRPTELELAREIAMELARQNGTVNADQVGQLMFKRHGIKSMGPAAGSIFKTGDFVFTGQLIPSERKTNHRGLIRIWKLKEEHGQEITEESIHQNT